MESQPDERQPFIRGMRLTVRRVVEAVALYPSQDDLFRNYPELEMGDVQQALLFAAANLEDRATQMRMVLGQGVPRDAATRLRELGYETAQLPPQ